MTSLPTSNEINEKIKSFIDLRREAFEKVKELYNKDPNEESDPLKFKEMMNKIMRLAKGLQIDTDKIVETPEEEEINTNLVREFLQKNGSPDWETFVTGSRCEGFTLSYGAFFKMNDDDDDDDDKYEKREKMQAEWEEKYPELNFYFLPCCWSEETGFDYFVGFNIYPLLWTKRRHFVGKNCLISAGDDFHMSKEAKDNILDQYKDHKLYEAPDFLKTEYINELYCNKETWKEGLYVREYPKLETWIPMLNDLYKDTILERTVFLQNFLADERMNDASFEWCFLPSDCAWCS